ncbi:MAG: PEP/pyruvate-binding domain-containing protein, partial [Microthrixaceae bacterium]
MRDEQIAVELRGDLVDPALLGGKGASLDRLVGLELLVPPSGVVTTTAYRRFVAESSLERLTADIRGGADPSVAEVDAAFLAVEPPEEMARAAVDLARRVGGGAHLAVRSSATVEDLAESSFAGQYRSLLDVDPADEHAVIDGVRLVFASLWHPAPCAYRRAMGVPDDAAAMAVVLMRMIPATRAGVVFTVDPGGVPGAARIEAVDGLGESLVSGDRTPDAWVTDRARPGDDVPAEARAALAAALAVESDSGVGQDVEWAWHEDRLWV